MEVYVECGSTAMAVDSAEDSVTANSNEEDSTTANYSLAANSATTNYSRIWQAELLRGEFGDGEFQCRGFGDDE
jgi:hypothetical protein